MKRGAFKIEACFLHLDNSKVCIQVYFRFFWLSLPRRGRQASLNLTRSFEYQAVRALFRFYEDKLTECHQISCFFFAFSEIDVVGLGVGVFFCVLGVTLVIYCITRASGCYGNGRHAPTEIKITYFDDGKANTYVNKGPSGTIMIEYYRSKLTSRETWLLQTRGTFIDISRVLVSLKVSESRWSHST